MFQAATASELQSAVTAVVESFEDGRNFAATVSKPLLRVLKKPRAAGSHSSFQYCGSNPFFDTSTLAVLQLHRVRKKVNTVHKFSILLERHWHIWSYLGAACRVVFLQHARCWVLKMVDQLPQRRWPVLSYNKRVTL